ncbi:MULTISPECIES: response regulator transcription factor [unclassified Halorhodospira]|uniref:response regulator transcription factor n=1 Tax=unclassified Halorhodospira TaxID=2626748 RepID=UPI001EE95905|nr:MULTISPECIES: response regulator transcription factor [unclassified Halorhodospira]MCG5541336.1 response regulator transcription factor [Halorhodospira sp. M39old]MCG5546908.1 response regulator transcription factor [Halorhodospira sp. M38]
MPASGNDMVYEVTVAEVCLLCKPWLQNRLLAEHLDQQLPPECRMADDAHLEHLLDDGAVRLLLLDVASSAHALDRASRMEEAGAPGAGPGVALLNVPPGVELGRYLAHSRILGVFPEGTGPDQLVRGVQAMLHGELWFPREALNEYLLQLRREGTTPAAATAAMPEAGDAAERARLDGLTAKEREVLGALGEGATNEAIGRELGMSVCTVKTHLYSIYRKLGVANRTAAALIGWRYLSGARSGQGAA